MRQRDITCDNALDAGTWLIIGMFIILHIVTSHIDVFSIRFQEMGAIDEEEIWGKKCQQVEKATLWGLNPLDCTGAGVSQNHDKGVSLQPQLLIHPCTYPVLQSLALI